MFAELLVKGQTLQAVKGLSSEEIRRNIERKLKGRSKPLGQLLKLRAKKSPIRPKLSVSKRGIPTQPSRGIATNPPAHPKASATATSTVAPSSTPIITSNREGYWAHTQEGSTRLEVDTFLKVALAPQVSHSVADPLLDEMLEFIEKGPTILSPFPESPKKVTCSSDLESTLQAMKLRSPNLESMEVENETLPSVISVTLPSRTPAAPTPPAEPSHSSPLPEPVKTEPNLSAKNATTTSFHRSLRPNLKELHKRGATKRVRIFLPDGSFVRMNQKKVDKLQRAIPRS